MENNLSQKRAWKTTERKGERRKLERRMVKGSFEDRRPTHKPYCTCSICELREIENNENPELERKAFMVTICMILAILMLIIFIPRAHAYEDFNCYIQCTGQHYPPFECTKYCGG